MPATGGWQTWTTVSHTVSLPVGQQDIAIEVASASFNLNWWSFTKVAAGSREASASPATATLYPNPVENQLTVSVPDAVGSVQITVFNAQGRQVLSRTLTGKAAGQLAQLPVAGLEPGIYSVRITNGETTTTQRFVKE